MGPTVNYRIFFIFKGSSLEKISSILTFLQNGEKKLGRVRPALSKSFNLGPDFYTSVLKKKKKKKKKKNEVSPIFPFFPFFFSFFFLFLFFFFHFFFLNSIFLNFSLIVRNNVDISSRDVDSNSDSNDKSVLFFIFRVFY